MAKRGRATGPAPLRERSITVNRKGAPRNKDLNLLLLRNNIKYWLKQHNALENLQLAGVQWNSKNNLTLMTYLPFLMEEMEKARHTIEGIIQQAMPGACECTKSEVWAKLIVHDIKLEFYHENEVGMNDLRVEIEKQTKCELAITLRYLTKPENRTGESHSSIVIALRNQ